MAVKQQHSPREELLQLQRSLYDRIRADIDDYLGFHAAHLQGYREEYLKELSSYKNIASKQQLLNKIAQSDIVYIGDYHTLRQAQRTVLRILREVILQGRQVILGLELVHHEQQQELDAYMAGKLHETAFLKKIDYEKNWSFEWNNYKQLFDFSRKYRLPLLGLNCHSTQPLKALKRRDQVASKIITQTRSKHPKALLVVLYGDLHICAAHIPREVELLEKRRSQQKRSRSLIVHQNSDELYWQLAQKGLEQKTDVVEIQDRIYCVMNTPPWVKLQTYLTWLEHRSVFALDSGNEIDDPEENYDYYHRMWDIADTIATFLDIDKEQLGDFNVYSSGDSEFLDYLNRYFKKQLKRSKAAAGMIRSEIIYNGTCLLPKEAMIYLSSLSVNHAAEKIAQLLHYRASKSIFEIKDRAPTENIYFGRVLLEAIGYIGSKIINYKRKCEHLSDFKKNLTLFVGKNLPRRLQELKQISAKVLEHFNQEQQGKLKRHFTKKWSQEVTQSSRILFGVTQAVGHILGERLYDAVLENQLPKATLRGLFMKRIVSSSDNQKLYFDLLSKLPKKGADKRSKSERF